jgi:hypothetical protein
MIANLFRSGTERHHFRVSRGIAVGDCAIARGGNRFVSGDNHRANRDLSTAACLGRLIERKTHKSFIAGRNGFHAQENITRNRSKFPWMAL